MRAPVAPAWPRHHGASSWRHHGASSWCLGIMVPPMRPSSPTWCNTCCVALGAQAVRVELRTRLTAWYSLPNSPTTTSIFPSMPPPTLIGLPTHLSSPPRPSFIGSPWNSPSQLSASTPSFIHLIHPGESLIDFFYLPPDVPVETALKYKTAFDSIEQVPFGSGPVSKAMPGSA